jgi:putative Mg2+ transporter-C (MgtC) family protein
MIDWDLYSTIALRLVLALIVGAVLGLNRWLHHKSAGIRTHSLVAIGSATAVMLISDFVHDDAQSVSRVLQGLITGLGFLGAGVIIHQQRSQKVHGLTTAASLWACPDRGCLWGGAICFRWLVFGGNFADSGTRGSFRTAFCKTQWRKKRV